MNDTCMNTTKVMPHVCLGTVGHISKMHDRMRAIRMDLRMQHIFNHDVVTMLEQMVQILILCFSNGIFNCKVIFASDEEQLFNDFVKIVISFDWIARCVVT
ncbi:hypothetical protein Syun_009115 [Stephania yunnanensis]|uniref:SAC3/GANP/THP3 conserved domain-containing protein n=1 Tax=Stephania yunnanensis TaxID=152371 RepID=A0AAP0PS00_9MAGN